ncbi:MAG: hypothetical protein CL878_07010 [Dehalococcoidia bacterium]|nr:hypothetical protein [Dehalococcoidia bacterium]
MSTSPRAAEPAPATAHDGVPSEPQQPEQQEGRGYGPVLRERPFLLLWLAQVCSQTAQNALNFGLIVEVERLTGSSTSVSLVVVSFTIPALLLGPPAGALVDRLSKRWVLILTNISRALLVLAFLATDRSVLAIYGLTMLNSALSQFFAPAEISTIPLVMPRRHLLAANSLFNMSFTLTQVLGFVLLGPTMLKLAGPLGLFAVVTAAYAVAALAIMLMPRLEQHLPPAHIALLDALRGGALWRDLAIGFEFLRTNRAVRTMLVLLSVTIAIVYLLATLGPGYVSRVLGFSPEDAGYVLGPAGLGILLASAAIGHWGQTWDRTRLVFGGLMAMAITLPALTVVRPLFEEAAPELAISGPAALPPWGVAAYAGVVGLVALLIGSAFALVMVPAQTVLVEATAPHLRGRIFAVLFVLNSLWSVIPILFAAALADIIGISQVILIVAAFVLLTAVLSLLPLLRQARSAAEQPLQ